MGCSGSLVIGENVKRIPSYMFFGCNGFNGDLTIPNSVETIGDWAFCSCSGFSGTLTIGSSVTTIGQSAFAGFSDISELHFNSMHCTSCAGDVFSGCSGSLIIGDNVTIIPDGAFSGCNFTGDLVIPNSVVEIGGLAFSFAGFDGLLIIPNTVTILNMGTFSNCGFTGELTIPNSITTIEFDCFNGCTGFTGCLEIPNSVTRIESNAFYGCSGLSCISIPNSVQSIGGNVFSETGWYNAQEDGIIYLDDWCLGYKGNPPTGTLNFQEGTKGIAGWAFGNCSGLTGVLTIPESIEYIGELAFVGCTGFTELHYNAINCTHLFYESPFYVCDGLTTLVIGNSVESIPLGIFSGVGFTGNLNIPNSVITIGEEAFANCIGFTGELILPNSLATIGYSAFSGCNGLTSIFIPNSVNSIGGSAFENTGWYDDQENGILFWDGWYLGYKGVKPNGHLEFQEGTRGIAGWAFKYCYNLTSMSIPNSVITIGDYAFYECRGLTSLDIPNSVITIGSSAFNGCNGLVSINIPNSVNTIGSRAFFNCSGLTSVTIGNSILSMGNLVFFRCTNLVSVNVLANSIPELVIEPGYLGIFGFPTSNSGFAIYVPYESVDVYKTATNWTDYAEYIQPLAYKTIPAYNESNNHWQFIASPLVDSIAPITVDNLITETAYDLYQFSPSDSLGEWQNYKAHTDDFKFVNGQGYLYANENEVSIIFKGIFNEDATKEVSLVYDVNAVSPGWNLVGNPFPCNAYLNREYYVMNEDGTGLNSVAVSETTPIPPCTAVFVKAETDGEMVVFARVAP